VAAEHLCSSSSGALSVSHLEHVSARGEPKPKLMSFVKMFLYIESAQQMQFKNLHCSCTYYTTYHKKLKVKTSIGHLTQTLLPDQPLVQELNCKVQISLSPIPSSVVEPSQKAINSSSLTNSVPSHSNTKRTTWNTIFFQCYTTNKHKTDKMQPREGSIHSDFKR